MKEVQVWSLIDGHTEIWEVESKSEFNNLFRYPWVGDGTSWEDL